MTASSIALRKRMIALLEILAPAEGYTLSSLDSVRFMRSNRPLARTPVLYEPSIVIVCQGRKRGFLGDDVYVYDADHYLVLSVPLPFSTETEASEAEPMLAVSVRIDLTATAELILAVDRGHLPSRQAPPKSIVSTQLDGRIADVVIRLLEAMTSPIEAQVLGPGIVREICFHVLMGEQGAAMRAALASQGHFGKIAKALRRIHAEYATDLDTTVLASEAGMSVPAFHAHFKGVTNTSPIQYLKSTRLHQARLLIIRNDMTAAAASAQVGYESPSQFSREFKRFFGRTPNAEAKHMKRTFALTPAAIGSGYVIAH
jgi:AraC-like DNA-binding protein